MNQIILFPFSKSPKLAFNNPRLDLSSAHRKRARHAIFLHSKLTSLLQNKTMAVPGERYKDDQPKLSCFWISSFLPNPPMNRSNDPSR